MTVFKRIKSFGISFLVNLGLLWLEKSVTRAIQISFILITTQLVLTLTFFSRLPNKVPLFYSLPWGQDRLANSQMLFLLPGLCLIILLINTIFSIIFIKSEKFLSLCLNWGSVIVSTFSLITLARIIFLIT